jgi:hypothetical protein
MEHKTKRQLLLDVLDENPGITIKEFRDKVTEKAIPACESYINMAYYSRYRKEPKEPVAIKDKQRRQGTGTWCSVGDTGYWTLKSEKMQKSPRQLSEILGREVPRDKDGSEPAWLEYIEKERAARINHLKEPVKEEEPQQFAYVSRQTLPDLTEGNGMAARILNAKQKINQAMPLLPDTAAFQEVKQALNRVLEVM